MLEKSSAYTRFRGGKVELLRSNMFRVTVDYIYKDILDYKSLEARCEDLLNDFTLGKHYKYDKKSALSGCYYLDCCVKNRKHIICDKGVSGNKFEALLKDTEFEALLYIRMGDNCYPVLLEIAKHADYTITLSHIISFKEFEPFEFCNARTGKKITNAIEFYQEYYE